MADWTPSLDPDLRDVLLEVAKDPRTALFRVTPRDIAVGALDDVPSASAGTAGWTAGERELLTVYREQVGELLRRAFAVRLEVDDAAKNKVLNAEAARSHPHQVRLEAQRLKRSPRQSSIEDTVRSFLGSVAEGELPHWPSLGELAHASLRMVDNDATRVSQAIDLIVRDEFEQGIVTARRAVGPGTRTFVRACAWSNIGLAHSLRGDSSQARFGFEQASLLAPYDVDFAANCFVNALSRGDRREVVARAKALDGMAQATDQEVRNFIAMNQARAYKGGMHVLKEWNKVLSSLEGLGSASWAIAHAIVAD